MILNDTSLSPIAIQALLNPVSSTSLTIQLTTQTSKILLNSVSTVAPILSQFFFVMGMNDISAGCHPYSKKPIRISGILRIIVSLLHTLVTALAMSGFISVFNEDWDVHGKQFCLIWMTLWLLMHINFLLFDTATSDLPMPVMPLSLLA